jgi:catechol 2,3-dioxygenase-like lactoylglutathione lyase family enzyme
VPPPAKRKKKATASTLTFNHAMIYVRDLAPALHFYGELLGFKLLEQYPGAYARLRSPKGQTTIALHKAEAGQGVESPGVRLYFETQQLEKFCKTLAAAGVQCEGPKVMPWGWKHAYMNDPDGHEVSLYWAGAKRFQKSKMSK